MELRGLTEAEVIESRARHGNNSLTQIMPEPLWKKVLHGFRDPMIMILLAALVIQAVLYFLGQAVRGSRCDDCHLACQWRGGNQ